ncbi:spermatogenesis-associated protein 16 [Stegastes partitus]|uniref:Spermatogenesis-associated protein 16 n=1 Tax=Stegastes partitus TaxID=144197 RepID=A0A9Y4JK24_9TELE|nr:PREDICTED: spermatogenesis-associated protein 16 [Stegastes partitus]
MRRTKRTADAATPPESRRASARASTGREVRRLRMGSDISRRREALKSSERTDEKDGEGGEHRRTNLPSAPQQRISLKRLLNVENSLAFGMEMLPTYSKASPFFSSSSSHQASQPSHTAAPASSLSGSQAHKSSDQSRGPNLNFLPPVDKGLLVLLQDADWYCRTKTFTEAAGSLLAALQLTSKGHVLRDVGCADPEEIQLVLSYIQAQLVVCYVRMKKPQLALQHAYRSIQLNPSHFQNHLRQAVVYRMLHRPWLAAKSVLTADWLYCLSGGTERRISTQLKLYWQAMLHEAQLVEEDICVMYTPYSGEPTAKDISRAEEACMEQHPALTDLLFTGVFQVQTGGIQFIKPGSGDDSRGGHILPQTTDWLSAEPQQYLLTLGFRRREDGVFLKNIFRDLWPDSPAKRGKRKLSTPKKPQKEEMETPELVETYKKVLPILDLMQATRMNLEPKTSVF